MTSDQKQAIFDLLKAASSNVYGYTTEQFSKEMTFADDQVKVPSGTSAAVPADVIDTISSKISHCTRCPLSNSRINTIPGKGVKNPAVLVISHIPGPEEESEGSPVAGKAGVLLDKELIAISLSTSKNCYITNIIKCKHTGTNLPVNEAESCISFLDAQIAALKPKMLLVVSEFAANILLKTSEKLDSLRGKFLEYKGLPVLVTYNPSQLIINESLKRPAWEDLKLFKSKLQTIAPDYDK